MASIPIKLCSHVFLVDMLHVGRTVVQEDVWVYRFRHSPKNAHQDLKPEPQTQASDVCSYFIPQTWVLVKEFNLSKLPQWGSIANILVSLIIMVAYAKLLLKSPGSYSQHDLGHTQERTSSSASFLYRIYKLNCGLLLPGS